MKIKMYEVFKEEQEALIQYLPKGLVEEFNPGTIQESGDKEPAELVCIRTQSQIPSQWDGGVKAILSRSQGFDHLTNIKNTSRDPARLRGLLLLGVQFSIPS